MAGVGAREGRTEGQGGVDGQETVASLAEGGGRSGTGGYEGSGDA